ncbi:MAG: hypothetical protein EXR75_00270 [Myxococcales bacterium]|nr:hypothetical protein [Myxococcales bacterium]
MLSSRLSALAVCAVLGLAAGHARAGSGTAAEDAGARLANEGLAHFEKGEFKEAANAFRRADEQRHSPVISLFRARSLAQVGQLVEALHLYAVTAAETPTPDASDAVRQAVLDAKSEHAALVVRVPQIRLKLGPRVVDVTIDGVAIAEPSATVFLDAGKHEAAGMQDGARFSKRFAAVVGEPAVVELGIPDGADVASTKNAEAGGSWLGPGIVLGLGGATVIASVATTVVLAGKAKDLDAACPDTRCPQSESDALASAATLGDVTTALWIIGGVTTAAGLTWGLVLGSGSSDSHASPATDEAPAAWRPSIQVGLGGVKLSARF